MANYFKDYQKQVREKQEREKEQERREHSRKELINEIEEMYTTLRDAIDDYIEEYTEDERLQDTFSFNLDLITETL